MVAALANRAAARLQRPFWMSRDRRNRRVMLRQLLHSTVNDPLMFVTIPIVYVPLIRWTCR